MQYVGYEENRNKETPTDVIYPNIDKIDKKEKPGSNLVFRLWRLKNMFCPS